MRGTKRVVSVSLGSSVRDHEADLELMGQRIHIQRIGTDGDFERALALFQELDGQVDALGVGGSDLTLHVGDRTYPLHSMRRVMQAVTRTPMVDGGGLKGTLERRIAQHVEAELGSRIAPKTMLMTSAADRYGMAVSFCEAGYDAIFGDLMFALGLPIPIRGLRSLRRICRLLLPVLLRLPLSMLYPLGDKQKENKPRFERYYRWASVVAGDFLYIRRHMPRRLEGKVIVTNSTTEADVLALQEAGAAYLVTTTPRLGGRTFGTNAMEACLVALAGLGRALTQPEMEQMLEKLELQPTVQRLQGS